MGPELGVVTAIGLMSGTSLDGVDVALIETDDERITRFGATGYRPYSDAERDLLRQALVEGAKLSDRWQRPSVLANACENACRTVKASNRGDR
jgi:anhydro-N-acetylmuramic acid kinase